MAIMFIRAQVISRGAGRGIVSAAAYRHRTRMIDERAGTSFRFEGGKAELVHEELALPRDLPAWLKAAIDRHSVAKSSEALWNAVDAFEKRADAQLAREMIFALPEELSKAENIALVREFVEQNLTSRGMVADWVYHDKDGNPHIHLMTTLRPLTEDGFGMKKVVVTGADGEPLRVVTPGRPKGKIVYRLWGGDAHTLKTWKFAWAETANRHLALAGHDVQIDGRSYAEQGLDGLATRHLGPARSAVARKGRDVFLAPTEMARRFEVADRIADDPGLLLKQLSGERSTFDERDIARALHRHIDDPVTFANVRSRLMASSDLVTLRVAERDPESGMVTQPAVFTTRDMLRAEFGMARSALALSRRAGFAVGERAVAAAIARIETRDPGQPFRFGPEQVDAVRHITRESGIAAIVGLAGAGKSTLLEAANLAWTAQGRRVIGGALAGKAAEALEESSGISSRTLASWELAWANGREQLRAGDILVIDEAGMIASQQLGRILKVVEDAGAKVVLVGDAMQLQPIQAGAAFRAITERVGYAELAGVRRQKDEWARDASRAFARGKVEEALGHYGERGHIVETDTRAAAIERIVADWSAAASDLTVAAARDNHAPRGDELLVLAHTNDDVQALNTAIRDVRITRGELSGSQAFATERGEREFAAGDRIIFLENARLIEPRAQHLGPQNVRNGMLGTVLETTDAKGRPLLSVRLDTGRNVVFSAESYRNIDHGYATTIHKSQGSTVDRTFVLATGMMDQHLAYVAMTRHRDRADLYAATEDFEPRPIRAQRADHAAGVTGILVDTGIARYRDDPDVEPSPYAELRSADGQVHRLWGVSLPDALGKAGASPGDTVTLTKDGTETVIKTAPVIDDETGRRAFEQRPVERNVWMALVVNELQAQKLETAQPNATRPAIFSELVARLGRSGEKTTTLDFESEDGYRALIREYADRRGIERVVDVVAPVEDALTGQLRWIDEQRDRLAQLWHRAVRAIGLAHAREDLVPVVHAKQEAQPEKSAAVASEQFLLAPAARFARSVEQEARRAQLASPEWQERNAELLQQLSRVYARPEQALARLNALVSRADVDPRVLGETLASEPSRLGRLKSSMDLGDWLAARRELRAAVDAIPELALMVRAQATAFRANDGRFIAGEERRRSYMAIGVPALSRHSAERLTELEAIRGAGGHGAYRTAFHALAGDRALSQEVKAVDEALTARFGWSAFTDKADDTARRSVSERLAGMIEGDRIALEIRFAAVRRFASELHLAEKRDPARIVVPAVHDPSAPVPAVPAMLPAVTTFAIGIEEEARGRVPSAPQYRAERDALGSAAARIWRDPQAALAVIEEKVRLGADPARLAAQTADDPASMGRLRGSDRLVERITAQGREHRTALAAAKETAWMVRGLAQTHATLLSHELQDIQAERDRMAVVVPGLSRSAEAELARLVTTLTREPKAFDSQVHALAPEIKAEFAQVSKALDARFGRGAITREEKAAVNMVPPAQRAAFTAMQVRLRAIQKAVTADAAHRISSERRLRALNQERGIER